MKNYKILLICIFLFLFACKKKRDLSSSEFISWFRDTTEKSKGVLFPVDSILKKIPKIESVDTSLLPVMRVTSLPSHFELEMPTVGNQGKLNNCVGWAASYGSHSYLTMKKLGFSGYNNSCLMSPMFIWTLLNNSKNQGVYLSEAMMKIKELGNCKFETMPPNPSFNIKPSQIQLDEATLFKAEQVIHIPSLDDLALLKFILSVKRTPLVFTIPVDFGFSKGTNILSFKKSLEGELIWKDYLPFVKKENHAMVICGYDDRINAFRVLNSWGSLWGNNGYCWIDYEFFKKNISKSENGEADLYISIVRKPEDKNKGLIAYYPFDGTSNDVSGNLNHGTSVNSPTYESGVSGQSIKLKGQCTFGWCEGEAGGHVLIPMPQFENMNAFTINLWVNENSIEWPDGEAYISFGNDQSNIIQIGHFQDKLVFSSSANSRIEVPFNTSYLNEFQMYTLVYENGILKAFRNGQNIGTMKNATKGAVGNTAAIARHWGLSTYTRFTGNIDQVRIYSRALNNSEISNLFLFKQ